MHPGDMPLNKHIVDITFPDGGPLGQDMSEFQTYWSSIFPDGTNIMIYRQTLNTPRTSGRGNTLAVADHRIKLALSSPA